MREKRKRPGRYSEVTAADLRHLAEQIDKLQQRLQGVIADFDRLEIPRLQVEHYLGAEEALRTLARCVVSVSHRIDVWRIDRGNDL